MHMTFVSNVFNEQYIYINIWFYSYYIYAQGSAVVRVPGAETVYAYVRLDAQLDSISYEDVLRSIEQDCRRGDPVVDPQAVLPASATSPGPHMFKAQALITATAKLLFMRSDVETEADTFVVEVRLNQYVNMSVCDGTLY